MAEARAGNGGDSAAEQEHPEEDRPLEDRVADEVREWSERLTRSLARSAARAREELEDVWAEAQNLRRGR